MQFGLLRDGRKPSTWLVKGGTSRHLGRQDCLSFGMRPGLLHRTTHSIIGNHETKRRYPAIAHHL
jgi:hypothetical protein